MTPLQQQVLDYLAVVETGSLPQIVNAVDAENTDVEDALRALVDAGQVQAIGVNLDLQGTTTTLYRVENRDTTEALAAFGYVDAEADTGVQPWFPRLVRLIPATHPATLRPTFAIMFAPPEPGNPFGIQLTLEQASDLRDSLDAAIKATSNP